MAKTGNVENAIKIQKNGENIGRLDISGEIGWDFYGDAWSAAHFKQQLDSLGGISLIELHINSPGGSVFDGIAIYNILVQHPAVVHTYIDGVAASIASVVAMAGDKIFMPDNTMLFIHKPWMYTVGNAEELRKDADLLDKTDTAITNSYLRHLKGSSDQISGMMADETWLTADETANLFRNVVVVRQKQDVQACLVASHLGNTGRIPKQAQAFVMAEEEVPKEGIVDKVVKILNRRGFGKACNAVLADLKELEKEKIQQEEDSMTPEERTALKDEIVQASIEGVAKASSEAVTAALIAAKVIPDPNVKVEEPKPIAFEGDPNKAEDVQAHLDKLDAAKHAEIMASGDAEKIKAHLATLKKTSAAPVGNVDVPNRLGKEDDEQLAKNREDTEKTLVAMLPKG